mmetsp:Transcript_25691/g.83295  ORF Transcript_25691/g.83295 Transcript_25691/m.83295 type:complete len:428 (-) Transcript_25691:238-1521(-)
MYFFATSKALSIFESTWLSSSASSRARRGRKAASQTPRSRHFRSARSVATFDAWAATRGGAFSSSLPLISLVTAGQSILPLVQLSSRRCISWTDRSATERASGSASSSASFARPGSNFGKKGAASMGSSTNLAKLQMMRATCLLRAVSPRWLRALARRGTTTDNVAESTDWTKVVAASLWTVSGTSFGRIAADTKAGRTWSMSLLPLSSKHSLKASAAASATSFFVSQRQVATAGTNWGSFAATCVGADEQNDVTPRSEATRVCHGSSVAMPFTKISTAVPVESGSTLNLDQAAWAANLTLFFFDPSDFSSKSKPLTTPASQTLFSFELSAASSIRSAASTPSGVDAAFKAFSSSATFPAPVADLKALTSASTTTPTAAAGAFFPPFAEDVSLLFLFADDFTFSFFAEDNDDMSGRQAGTRVCCSLR